MTGRIGNARKKLTLTALFAHTPHLVTAAFATNRSQDTDRLEVVLSSAKFVCVSSRRCCRMFAYRCVERSFQSFLAAPSEDARRRSVSVLS